MDYFSALRAFARAVELGSFSAAAADQDVKVSTISRYVSALEADLGAAVFNRTTRKLHLTEVGSTLYERAVHILSDVEDAREAARSLNQSPQGLLRLNVPGSFGRHHVVPHLPAFLAAYPQIRVDVLFSETPLDLVLAGIDFAIQMGSLSDSSMVAKRLAVQDFVVVASATWLESHRAPESPGDLANMECLTAFQSNASEWHFAPRSNQDGNFDRISVRGRLRTDDPDAILRTALDGVGVALLPTWLVSDAVKAGDLITVLDDWKWSLSPFFESAVWGLYPPKKVVSPKVRSFLDFMTKRFSGTPYWDRPLNRKIS